jgi:hypothetical protein
VLARKPRIEKVPTVNEIRERSGCGGLQPSEFVSPAVQNGAGSACSVARVCVSLKLPDECRPSATKLSLAVVTSENPILADGGRLCGLSEVSRYATLSRNAERKQGERILQCPQV